ncbi:MAG: hypothetical protein Q8P50_08750 [Bacillota bacterium]|nr:hypothetical protein [Bacillota bacterium]
MLVTERLLALGLVLLIACSMLAGLARASRTGRGPSIRRIAALDALTEVVGRATEMGRPVHFTAGTGRLTDQSAPMMLASLDVVGRTAGLAASYGARLLVTCADPVYHAMTTDRVRSCYTLEGRPDQFRPEDVKFLSDTQFAYAAGVIGLIEREKVAANIVVGSYGAEGLLLAEAGANAGALQIAGTTNMNILPFFVVACDYVLLGEEMYAAGAYLSQDKKQAATLASQDYAKLAVLLGIVLGVVTLTFGSRTLLNLLDTFGK